MTIKRMFVASLLSKVPIAAQYSSPNQQ